MSISERIQQLRKSNGLSQEQLAEKLDVSRQAVSKWESGSSVPDVEKIVLISELFGVTTDYLMKDEAPGVCGDEGKQSIQGTKKLYIVDVNKRRLSAFDEFAIEMLNNKGEASLITGIGKSGTKVKVPVCILYGVKKGILGMNKRTTLGFYASLEDAEKELNNISKAKATEAVYELKYAAKMQGVRIEDKE